ncbi:MAG: hypothetical protein QF464_22665, partial [Myxococcota bacterium]|nr:hypothetical protein [Myxococcota bacterium]
MGPNESKATLSLQWRGCAPNAAGASTSFVFEHAGPDAAKAALLSLQRTVERHDDGTFWQTFIAPPPETYAPTRSEPKRAKTEEVVDRPGPGPGPPFNESVASTALVLLLALCALLFALAQLWRESVSGAPSPRRVALSLLGLTSIGAGLRWLAEPTFIREAYPLPNVSRLVGESGLALGSDLYAYPHGMEIAAGVLWRLFSDDPYAGWFATNVLIGTLTIPLAWFAGTRLLKDHRGGLVVCALIALWPQHIRLSASESTHVLLVFWTMAALATTLAAAETGRLAHIA